MTNPNDPLVVENQSTDDIRSALWHIAAALNGIKLKLDQLDASTHALCSISNSLDEFVEPFQKNSSFKSFVDLIEKQTQILEEQHHMKNYR